MLIGMMNNKHQLVGTVSTMHWQLAATRVANQAFLWAATGSC